jgi:lysophospholipase L1-like esterase
MTNNPEHPAESCWEPDIRAFEALDRQHWPPEGGILFLGSSTIAMWHTLDQDFQGWPLIRRGFGGSQISDSIRYADRIVIPYKPRLIVFYAGDNDLASGRTPMQVAQAFQTFATRVREALPQVTILYLAIKPSPSRWHLADPMRAANRLIEATCKATPGLAFLDVFTPMLGADGKPRPELYIEDQLHMSRQGYELWIDLLRPVLAKWVPVV